MRSKAPHRIGSGSQPASATRPAKIEIQLGGPFFKLSSTSSTCAMVIIAVTLTFTPSRAKRRINGAELRPRVSVMGIFT